MFSRIERRLLLWYTGVLALILLAAGVLIYTATQQALLGPVDSTLVGGADSAVRETFQHGGSPCEQPPFARHNVPYIACYSADGSFLDAPGLAAIAPAFRDPALVARVMNHGEAFDTIVEPQNAVGSIRRYARVVTDPKSGVTLGVVQLGFPISDRTNALQTLLTVLLWVGALTLFGAGCGGLFLSRRALAPARLSFARQQRFIADASHELRTPLTLMRADAEVLLRGGDRLRADDADLLRDIVSETEHLSHIATNLLTLARLDSGAYHLERDILPLGEVAASVIRRAAALAEARQINLDTTADPQTLVVGDRMLLEQAALILLDNAIKYNHPGGKVSVRATVVGQQARLEVQDTGEGIAAENQAQLGERFYRVDKARSREDGGAGLGLSIARGVAAAHGGSLTIVSEPGQGTTATLSLPAVTGRPGPTGGAPTKQ